MPIDSTGMFLTSLRSRCLTLGSGLACLALGLHCHAAPPTLSWSATENRIELHWPAAEGAYLLEESVTLAAGGTWSQVLTPPKEVGGEFVVALTILRDTRFFRLRTAPLTTIQEVSPADGETGVAVTRETVLRLSNPLAVETTLGPEQLFAEFGGRRILSRVELASDRKTVTLFYLENLPGNARVRVTLHGDTLRDVFSRIVDADGDGQPGGTRVVDFDTLSLTPVPKTAVIGRVLASELVPGQPKGQSLNRPLTGVTITLDGLEETVRTVTDGQGNFKLAPVPAGRFFVHVDGRTVTDLAAGIHYPDQSYYPFVGKAWEAVAGREDNLAGGTGEVYLPRVIVGTLQPVSATADVAIEFPDAVTRRNPELAGVSITVPPNALLSENGARGGQVGIAPVSPDRLPEPLPPGLDFPLVITVQTDGPANFDRPVPVRFPNLPDRETGEPLSPGAKSALWSFNHDTGNWEIAGSMTVTADGKFVESDPGVGIRQPGWHASAPGSQGQGGNASGQPCEDRGCHLGPISIAVGPGTQRTFSVPSGHSRGIVNWFAPTGYPQGGAGDVFTTTFCTAGSHTVTAVLLSNCGQQRCERTAGATFSASEAPPVDPCTLLRPLVVAGPSAPPYIAGETVVVFEDTSPQQIGGTICYSFEGVESTTPCNRGGSFIGAIWCRPGTYRLRRTLTLDCGTQCTMDDGTITIEPPTPTGDCSRSLASIAIVGRLPTNALEGDTLVGFEPLPGIRLGEYHWRLPGAVPEEMSFAPTEIPEFTTFLNTVGRATVTATFKDCTTGETCTSSMTIDVLPPRVPSPYVPRFEFGRSKGAALTDLRTRSIRPGMVAEHASRRLALRTAAHRLGRIGLQGPATDDTLRGLLYFALVNVQNDRIVRGIAGSDGVLHPEGIQVAASTPYREYVLDSTTLNVGSTEFTSAPIGQNFEMPTVYVNSKENADADGDELSDLGELVMGTDPNKADSDGDGVRDGAEVQSGGDPLSGIAVRTGVMAAASTPGPAVDVSAANDLAAVACKDYGLVLFNVFNGLDPVRIGQVETPGEALRVASAGTVAAVADGAKGLAIVDLSEPPAARIQYQVSLGAPVVSVAVGAGVVFAGTSQGVVSLVDLATGSRLAETTLEDAVMDLVPLGDFLCAVTPAKLHVLAAAHGTLAAVGSVDLANTEHPRRLFPSDGSVLVVNRNGVGVYEVKDGVPRFRQTLLIEPLTVPDLGWEHLVLNGSGTGLAAISQPTVAPGPGLRLYNLPAPSGLMTFVEALDFQGTARATSIYNGIAYVAADAAGLQVVNYLARDTGSQAPTLTLSASFPLEPATVEEGKSARITANVGDDVQVRNVTFLIDGVAVATDGNYPFEHRFITPLRAEESTFTVAAVATDTGGNETRTSPITVTVTADTTAPQVVAVTPADGATLVTARSLAVFFDEPVAAASLTPDRWRLIEAGPDGQLATVDDVEVNGGSVEYRSGILATLLSFPKDLPPGSYRAQLLPGVRDLAGTVRGTTHTWSFTLVGVSTTTGPKLATGQGHTVVIEPDGSLWGWGNNFGGQIGDGGPQEDGRRPARIGSANDWLTVAAVRDATAAIKTDGSLWTWGEGRRSGAVLGQGDGVRQLDSPTRVGNGSDWRFVAGGDEQFFAVKADGTLWAWGTNEGTFGTGTVEDSNVPVRVGSDSDWTAVSTGGEEGTLGLKRDGSIWFWDGNPFWKTDVPARIGTGNDWMSVAALRSELLGDIDDSSQVALKADGTLWYLGFENRQYVFARLGNDSDWKELAAGDNHLLALKTDGSLWALGDNDEAQLGDGTLNHQLTFVRVAVPGEVVAVATRFDQNVALTRDGTYYTWGDNSNGQLALGFTGTPQPTPLRVGTDTDWASIAFGQSFAVALKSDGALWTWGINFNGELGLGTKVGQAAPVRVGAEVDWLHVAAGNRHVMAVKQDGTLWGWGLNSAGQLALDPGQALEQLAPAPIGADQDWASVAAGLEHSLAIKTDGSLWAWGANNRGQLGDGTTQRRFTPTRIGADTDWQSVIAGGIPGRSSFALKRDGSLWAWGENRADFQFLNADFLGVGDTTNRLQPTRIGTNSFWRSVAVGGAVKRLIKTDGTLWTWRGIKGSGASFQQVEFEAGSTGVRDSDLLSPPSLIARLVQHSDSVSAFLWNLLDPAHGFAPESQQLLADPNTSLAERLNLTVATLNVAISGPLIYDAQRFAGIPLSAETQALLAQNPTGDQLRQLNRLLLEDAYPQELLKYREREWAAVSVGDNHWLGVRKDGSLWGEGSNTFGELGTGQTTDRSQTFQRVNEVRAWSHVATGQGVSAGIRTDGTLWTWGDYSQGLLGHLSLLRPRAIGNSTNWATPSP